VNGVPIGKPLIETDLFLREDVSGKVLNVMEIDSDAVVSGTLLHSSSSRLCYVDNQRSGMIESADQVCFLNGRLYIKGRSSRTTKINGKLVDFNQIEAVTLFVFDSF
jgi:hypothetical protein